MKHIKENEEFVMNGRIFKWKLEGKGVIRLEHVGDLEVPELPRVGPKKKVKK